MNIDILVISELKWTGMDEFNPDDLYIYYCGQESFRRNDRMISVYFQGKPFNSTVILVCVLTSNTKEAEVEQFYEDLQDLLELTPQKDVL